MITHQRNTLRKTLVGIMFEAQCSRILLLLASFALGIGNTAGQDYILLSQAPWAHWAQNPGILTLVVNVSAMAAPGTTFTGALGSTVATGSASNDCSALSDPIVLQSGITPYKTMQLTVSGISIYKVHVDLTRPTSLDLRVGNHRIRYLSMTRPLHNNVRLGLWLAQTLAGASCHAAQPALEADATKASRRPFSAGAEPYSGEPSVSPGSPRTIHGRFLLARLQGRRR